MGIQLSIIIPVFNERDTVEEILTRVAAVDLDKEIIVVDDGSTDGSREILEDLKKSSKLRYFKLFSHDQNQGKGAALRTGIAQARGEFILIQDADLEYDPKDYPLLLFPLLDGRADVVYGSRFLGGPHRVFYFWHYVGNRFLTLLSNILTNLNLSDMETCYKVFRRQVFDHIQIRSNRFEFEPEITAKVARKGYRIYETPISYSGRSYAEGKKITWVDGVRSVWAVFRFRFFD